MSSGNDLARLCGALLLGGYEDQEPPPAFLARLASGQLAGAILFRRNLPAVEAGYESARWLIEAAPPDAPPWIAVDQEGGRVRRLLAPVLQLPSMRTLAAAGDPELIGRAARVLGLQLRALGFNLDFAPVLDVDTNPANPIIGDRSFGRDPRTVASMGNAFAQGLQQSGVSACGKHFPGHGDTSLDSHLALPRVDTSLQRMRDVELVPFREAVVAGIDAMMSAHIVCPAIEPGVPATLSAAAIDGLLRSELGFDGVVFSDDLEMKAIADRWGMAEAAVAAIRAGCDVVCICKSEALQQEAHEGLIKACESDASFRSRCAQAAERSRRLRRLRPPRPSATIEQAMAWCASAESVAVAREVAERCKPA